MRSTLGQNNGTKAAARLLKNLAVSSTIRKKLWFTWHDKTFTFRFKI